MSSYLPTTEYSAHAIEDLRLAEYEARRSEMPVTARAYRQLIATLERSIKFICKRLAITPCQLVQEVMARRLPMSGATRRIS